MSVVFDRRSQAESTLVIRTFGDELPGRKLVTCRTPNQRPVSRDMFKATLAQGFDVFDCDLGADWAARHVIESLANAHAVWMTMIRDPFESLLSHYMRGLRNRKGGNVANCANVTSDQVVDFYLREYRQYLLEEFGSFHALHDEISTGKICSRWDVILEAETVRDDVANFLNFSKFPEQDLTAPLCGGVTDLEAVVIKAELREEYEHHRALLACKKKNKRLCLIDGSVVLSV